MTQRFRSLALVTIGLLVAISGSSAEAQARKKLADDPDMKELAGYRLTMDMVNRVERATRDMAEAMKKDPKYAERMKLEADLAALQKKDEPSDADQKKIEELEARKNTMEDADSGLFNNAQTLSDMEASIKRFPPMANALANQKIAPREYAKFMMAMIQASFAAALQKAGKVPKTPEGVNPENVKFVIDHEAELKKIQESMQEKGSSK